MRWLVGAVSGLTLAWASYLLTLLVSAALHRGRRQPAGAPGAPDRANVLVPAHDEEAGLPVALDSLTALEGLGSAKDIFVIADNCSDGTADVARSAGVSVLERAEPDDPGKGQALAWALKRLLAGPDPPDVVVMVDADCTVTPNALLELSRVLHDGADAAQAAYVVSNADEGSTAALRAAAFSLMNVVRPAGKTALGVSAGLLGTGMAFKARTLRAVEWRAFGVAEDAEYHLRLIASKMRVDFVESVKVRSPMPTTFQAGRSQQLRWEGGRAALVRPWVPRLLTRALRERDPAALHAAVELLVPAMSVQVGLQVVALASACGLRNARLALVPAIAMIATGVYVVGGLVYVRAPREIWLALLHAPVLIVQKVGIVGSIVRRGKPVSWDRTERETAAT